MRTFLFSSIDMPKGGTMTRMMSMSEVARLAMVAPHQLQYAFSRGRLREPTRVNGRRAFNQKDLERVKEYFNRKDGAARTTTLPL
ncbi:MAG: MerR family transcriptional regulator [Bacteroidetes bacterium]|nr:MerR family transcriptional regulator [Bacteroidota bacterium]